MKREITKRYNNGEITVKWQPGLCIHSANCVKGLPKVFDSNRKPWIDVHAENSERIKEQVLKCPSGALSLEGMEVENSAPLATDALQAGDTPMVLELEANKNYAWCACGRSKKQPWCDGSHKITQITPLIFKLEDTSKKALCMCKQSKSQPFCDGTHNRLP